MFFTEEYLSDTEKINRIYKMLRAQRRAALFWLFIKLSLLGIIVYGFHYLSLPENVSKKEEISATVQAKISEFIMPLVGNMVQDLTQNMLNPEQSGTVTRKRNIPAGTVLPANISPELIKAAQDMLNKK